MSFVCKILDLIEKGYEIDFRPDTSAGCVLIEFRKYSQALKKEFKIRNVMPYRDMGILRDFESDEYLTNTLQSMEHHFEQHMEKEIHIYAEN